MLVHFIEESNLELFVDDLPIEQVRVFKFLAVLLNDHEGWRFDVDGRQVSWNIRGGNFDWSSSSLQVLG